MSIMHQLAEGVLVAFKLLPAVIIVVVVAL